MFIHKFERYASDLNWDESAKLLHLISCLEGKALAIYRRIEMDKVANYHELRRELEKAFSLTAEQLGNAFNNATKKPDETATQFAANLKEKFVNWYRKANNCHNMSTEGLLNHVIKEQFVKSLPTQCKQEIKQHKLINMNEVAKYAENYFEAHQVERKVEVKKPQGKAVANNLLTNNNPSTGNLNKNFHCRNCKTNNHWYFECPNRKKIWLLLLHTLTRILCPGLRPDHRSLNQVVTMLRKCQKLRARNDAKDKPGSLPPINCACQVHHWKMIIQIYICQRAM